MRFLITAKPCETDARKAATKPFDAALFSAYMKYNEEMAKAGVLVVAEGLNPDGFRARVVPSRCMANGDIYHKTKNSGFDNAYQASSN